ncbi:ribosomal RNA small subunit methyltransferase, mitochondrial [Punica granatum]|uniref:rRNA adenine N(6)-methyltransferase n=2 Tax=Punica granatum TaxID=22663 RepID=A0A2I0KNS9_PUNGR|nr:ribosomal RNA small subunit methyltransferase, mitochondrial [Punica granatum]PKI69990.1 hypothetical protein CRG98_009593 [Punica granatum]
MLRSPKYTPRWLIPSTPLFRRLLSDFALHQARKSSDEEDDPKYRIRKQDPEGQYLHLHKSKGQHILTNPRVLDVIVRRAGVGPTDTVLEVGPGTGNLTLKLLGAALRVVAVEIDRRMVDVLIKRVEDRGFGDKLTVIQRDALKAEFPPFDVVVANIPYGISSPLVAKLVYGPNQFRNATLLLQKEFARRLLANPGDSEYNRLAVNVKLVADVELVMDVSKRDFVPVPKVDSSVVIIRPKAEVPAVDLNEWWAFTRTCFGKKNKTLGATFKQKRKLMEIFKTSKTTSYRTGESSCGFGEEEGVDCGEESEGEDCCPVLSVSEGEIGLFREKVVSVLRLDGFEDKRPSKLSNDELLHLLGQLNGAGIYFHGRGQLHITEDATLAAT